MKTLLTIEQQKEWLSSNWKNKTLRHYWSTNGYGNSKIFDKKDKIISKASGCGYDRFGTVVGGAMTVFFPDLINYLGKTKCTGKRRNYKKAKDFYGLFYNSISKKAWLDGGCGIDCMKKIINKIGFTLEYVGGVDNGRTGNDFYNLIPITKHDRKYL
ncbi:MAG: hypothetical protein GY928_20880 [Colwellia sp.]|nr:hypothetical protein [Colwellia sp.]